jgi:hypothetical protein
VSSSLLYAPFRGVTGQMTKMGTRRFEVGLYIRSMLAELFYARDLLGRHHAWQPEIFYMPSAQFSSSAVDCIMCLQFECDFFFLLQKYTLKHGSRA